MDVRECFKEMLKLDSDKLITEELLPRLNGKSLYSNYQVGDRILHFIIREIDYSKDEPEVNLTCKSIAERELELIENDFEFIDIFHGFPVFERKKK